MTPVDIISLPHNRRCAVWPGEVDDEGEPYGAAWCTGPFADLPIPMPRGAFVLTGRHGEVLALFCDDLCIRREDLQTVWLGICQYNADCEAQGEEQQ